MDAKSLLSPTVIFSQGCSVAGICQDQQSHRYISKELFKLGAVAFFGNGRPGGAVTSQVYTHTLNKILEGQSLGLAYKDSLACKLVYAWDHPQHKNHLRAYFNSAFYGDPAMAVEIDSAPRLPPAKSFYANDVYKLTVPKEVFSFPLDKAIMDEWKWSWCKFICCLTLLALQAVANGKVATMSRDISITRQLRVSLELKVFEK